MKAITNGTILCPVKGLIEEGTILFDEKKIHEVGKSVKVPDGTDVIDAKGKFVLPGFIDAHCHQGLFDGSIGWAGGDGNEMTTPITPELRGIDSFNPFEPSLNEVLIGGVTSINTNPNGDLPRGLFDNMSQKIRGSTIVHFIIRADMCHVAKFAGICGNNRGTSGNPYGF